MNRRPSKQAFRTHSQQSGLALVIALIVLVAMTLASVGMVRSIDTAVMIAGNMAFRQGATAAGDAGVEAARNWLMTNSATLINDSPSSGYYANSQKDLDLTGNKTPSDHGDDVAWEETGVVTPKCLPEDDAGNTVCYIVHRMCNESGEAISSSKCSVKQTSKTGSNVGGKRQMETYQQGSWTDVANQTYYRITVRIAGPRNNTSFTQVFMLI